AVLLIVIVATGLAGLWTSRALRGPASLQAVADGAIEAYRNVPWSTPAPTAPVAASAADLTGWASKALGHRVRIPDLADGGYRLVGRWVQHGDGGPRIVTVAFEDATGGRVLCYFSRRNATDESALRYRDAGNVGAVFRIDEGVGYAVAGTVGRRELTRIAELAYPADREEESTGE
ncbi:MAG TPA: hypothetical protein VKA32_04720, partial [Gammaproteobacteria bacterium]|nr:hypothetical protein [Gammaproteobacteria bacterium]